MARKPAAQGSPEWRQRVSEGSKRGKARKAAREARLARVERRHLRELRAGRDVHPVLVPIVEDSREERADLIDALGGPDRISAQRMVILEDLVAVGLVLRSELLRYAQSRDPEIVSRITSCANTRRAALSALGLERVARDVPRLGDYVAAAVQNGAGATFDVQPESEASTDG